MATTYSLTQLDWSPFFQQQLSLEEWEHYTQHACWHNTDPLSTLCLNKKGKNWR